MGATALDQANLRPRQVSDDFFTEKGFLDICYPLRL
jgi:hypothetical protein